MAHDSTGTDPAQVPQRPGTPAWASPAATMARALPSPPPTPAPLVVAPPPPPQGTERAPLQAGSTAAAGPESGRPGIPLALVLVAFALLVAACVGGTVLWRTATGSPTGTASSVEGTAATTDRSEAREQEGSPTAAVDETGSEDEALPDDKAATAPPAAMGESLTAYAAVRAPSTSASAVDGAKNPISYAAQNMLDGDPTTTWRMDGDGTGETVTILLDEPRTVAELGLVNGYAKTDPVTGEHRYVQGRRITGVTWDLGDRSFAQDLVDGDESAQSISVPPTTTQSIRLTIDAVTGPGDDRFDQTAISELMLYG